MKPILLLFFIWSFSALLQAQEPARLSLQEVIEMAKSRSIASRQAATRKETQYWVYKTYQSNYKPQLLLDSRLPAFVRSFQEVVQPDGAILFQPVRYNNSSVGLSLEQNIARTGGTIYAATQLQRFDDFYRHNKLYNSTLFAIGFNQPLSRYNGLKWDKKIEPLKYNESRQEYLETLEAIAYTANNLFFGLYLAQSNLTIAETNLKNTTDILAIAQEKFDLGKTSRNEILQLQLEQLKSQKAVANARRDLEISTLNLKAYTGLQESDKFELIEPVPSNMPTILPEKALEEALANRAGAIAFGRRILEAEREVARAKGETGLRAALTVSAGFSNRGENLDDLSRKVQDQEQISLDLSMPILDWGRSESRLKTAEANQKLISYTVEQDKQTFNQQVYTEVILFEMLKNQLTLTAMADTIASEKYQIARERYVLGNLSITDLSIAFAEKDQAKRDYIGALKDYWAAYYWIRRLTLYDFDRNEKIRE